MTEVVDHAQTRAAVRRRRAKAEALAAAAAGLGVVPCELRQSHPDRAVVVPAVWHAAGLRRVPSLETLQLTAVLLDARLMEVASGRCPQCGSPVLHVLAGTAGRLALNPLPHPDGDVEVKHPSSSGPPTSLGLRPGSPCPPDGAYRRHADSCPLSLPVQHRRPRTKRRCTSCFGALSPLLPVGTELHPTCGGDL